MVTADLSRRIIESEEYKLQKADLVIVVSEALRASKSKLNRNTHVFANGVDTGAYAGLNENPTASNVMAGIPRPRIGYSGLIASRLDLALLLELTRHRPDYSIVLLGAVDKRDCRSQIGELENLENVHFLGLKPAADVPKYIEGFDVCMIPYARNERARYADPLKLYEYGAAGKEVVCTELRCSEERGAVLPYCGIRRRFPLSSRRNAEPSNAGRYRDRGAAMGRHGVVGKQDAANRIPACDAPTTSSPLNGPCSIPDRLQGSVN